MSHGLRRIELSEASIRGGRGWRAPVMVCNPADDDAFCAAAETGLRDAPSSPADLQAVLRVHYPLAVVREREIASEPSAVWYVYRDGRWTHGASSAEGVA